MSCGNAKKGRRPLWSAPFLIFFFALELGRLEAAPEADRMAMLGQHFHRDVF